MKSKKASKFFNRNYLILLFAACIFFVGLVAVVKITFTKTADVYVKIKLGQGMWWATTAKPPVWYVDSISVKDTGKDLLGKTQAVILEKRYFRWYLNDQFDVYLTMKLSASYSKKKDEYTYDHSVISVGAPIEVQLTKSNITGTVMAISKTPFKDKYVEKIIYLTKRNAFPWEYDAIKVGDVYFDGKETIFSIMEKSEDETSNLIVDDYGNGSQGVTEPRKYITVKAWIKLKQVNGQLILGEEQVITPGKNFLLATQNYQYDNYVVSKIE